MNREKRLKLYHELLRIRIVEETISKKYPEGKMRCPVHLSIGQEAPPVGICSNLKKTDQIVSAHRSHAHYLAKGGGLNPMIAELYGKKSGCAKGVGGSMHLIAPEVGMVAAVPIVGSSIPIAVGLAWSNKLKKNDKVVVVFFGDGAIEEGSFHESLNFSVLHSLPILFVCENNNFSVYTSYEKRQSTKRKIYKIASAHGIKSVYSEGNNVFAIAELANEATTYIKEKKAPFFVELNTFRHMEHCGPSTDDGLGYRSKKYVDSWLKKDPILVAEKILTEEKLLTGELISKFRKEIESECEKAFQFAEDSEFPDKSDLFKNLYI